MDKSDILVVRAALSYAIGLVGSSMTQAIIQITARTYLNNAYSQPNFSPIKYYGLLHAPALVSLAGTGAALYFIWRSRQSKITVINTVGFYLVMAVVISTLVGLFLSWYSTNYAFNALHSFHLQ